MKKILLLIGLLFFIGVIQVVKAQSNNAQEKTSSAGASGKVRTISPNKNTSSVHSPTNKAGRDSVRKINPNYDKTNVAGPNPRKRNSSKKKQQDEK